MKFNLLFKLQQSKLNLLIKVYDTHIKHKSSQKLGQMKNSVKYSLVIDNMIPKVRYAHKKDLTNLTVIFSQIN
jgi:hypothetical protein